MFAAVARRYDLLNHLLSAGLDHRWRQRAASAVSRAGRGAAGAGPLVVDVCAGTGDLARAVRRRMPEARVIACDFCRPMLELARRKGLGRDPGPRIGLVEADALALPMPDASADAVVCGFGLRNLADPGRGLAEMARVVRPGGRVVVLEFHRPRGQGPLAGLFSLYFHRVLPRLGAWVAGGDLGGYGYLVASIEGFGLPEETARALRGAGLEDVRVEPLPGDIASVYAATKP